MISFFCVKIFSLKYNKTVYVCLQFFLAWAAGSATLFFLFNFENTSGPSGFLTLSWFLSLV